MEIPEPGQDGPDVDAPTGCDPGAMALPFWKLVPGDSLDLLVVFAHRDAERFAFFRATEHLPCDRLFLRDPTLRGWYNGGVPGLGGTIEKTGASLRAIVGRRGYARVFALGSSMGGYAPLLYGALLGVTGVLAFNPRSLLDPVFPLSPPEEVDVLVKDVLPQLDGSRSISFDVAVSEDDAVDLFHLARLSAQPHVRPWTVRGASHLVTEELDCRGELRPLLLQWITGEPADVLAPLPMLRTAALRAALARGVHGFMAGRIAEALDGLQLAVLVYPGHPGLSHFLGIAALQAGRSDVAVEAFRAALAYRKGWSHTEGLLRQAVSQRTRP